MVRHVWKVSPHWSSSSNEKKSIGLRPELLLESDPKGAACSRPVGCWTIVRIRGQVSMSSRNYRHFSRRWVGPSIELPHDI
ncbi:hypothetical protein J1N35_004688 [Gossypium stocksii]|uniref:Uncharacterized protein n=1 Tax=Gossypium stocksii TaxID=47602 RepID=A0A9D3WD74_9ROSI|nr:hypothetical protein J1N35_004688 [Gossypium stocksii]